MSCWRFVGSARRPGNVKFESRASYCMVFSVARLVFFVVRLRHRFTPPPDDVHVQNMLHMTMLEICHQSLHRMKTG